MYLVVRYVVHAFADCCVHIHQVYGDVTLNAAHIVSYFEVVITWYIHLQHTPTSCSTEYQVHYYSGVILYQVYTIQSTTEALRTMFL